MSGAEQGAAAGDAHGEETVGAAATGHDEEAELTAALRRARWIGRDPGYVPEFWPPVFDDRPEITRDMEPVRLLRCEVPLSDGIRRARMLLTAKGLVRARLDGAQVGADELIPGWTDYRRRIQYECYDVTAVLQQARDAGQEARAARDAGQHPAAEGGRAVRQAQPGGRSSATWQLELADGWFAGYLGMDRRHQAGRYGTHTAARGILLIDYADGSRGEHATGPGWQLGEGPIRYADLLMGQGVDFTVRPGGWQPAWVDHDDADAALLVPRRGPAIRVVERLAAVSQRSLPGGRILVDFGQNLVGWVRLQLPALEPGTRIHLRHAETLDAAGEPYFDNLRTARAHDLVVSAGGREVFEPEFTLHGFRYLELRGHPGPLELGDAQAAVVGSAVGRIGRFACDDPELEQLERAIAWTIRGNLVSVPTDCPQRDERLGWLGDAQLIMPTAASQFELSGFLGKWLQDIRDGQAASGAYPDVAPRVVVEVDGSPGWADAGVLVPWTLARYFPPERTRPVLAEHYPSMRRFMAHLESQNPGGIREHGLSRNYGDWLNLDDHTPKELLATVYWKRCLDAMAGMAALLGETDDARHWRDWAQRVSAAFRERFVAADGSIGSGSQSGYALAITGGMLGSEGEGEGEGEGMAGPGGASGAAAAGNGAAAEANARAGRLLAEAVRARGTALSCGIHGLAQLLPALTASGQLPLAYALLNRSEYPGWRYPLRQGATTIWERWDGSTEDRGFQTPAMNSFNHYALGSVGQWLYDTVAGLGPDPEHPGFEQALIQPHPGGGLRRASAERQVVGGTFRVHWELQAGLPEAQMPAGEEAPRHGPESHGGEHLLLLAEVPEAHRARLRLPSPDTASGYVEELIGPGVHRREMLWHPEWVPAAKEMP